MRYELSAEGGVTDRYIQLRLDQGHKRHPLVARRALHHSGDPTSDFGEWCGRIHFSKRSILLRINWPMSARFARHGDHDARPSRPALSEFVEWRSTGSFGLSVVASPVGVPRDRRYLRLVFVARLDSLPGLCRPIANEVVRVSLQVLEFLEQLARKMLRNSWAESPQAVGRR